jgi:hypothetical protein
MGLEFLWNSSAVGYPRSYVDALKPLVSPFGAGGMDGLGMHTKENEMETRTQAGEAFAAAVLIYPRSGFGSAMQQRDHSASSFGSADGMSQYRINPIQFASEVLCVAQRRQRATGCRLTPAARGRARGFANRLNSTYRLL